MNEQRQKFKNIPLKVWSSDVLKTDIEERLLRQSNTCRIAAIARIAERKEETVAIKPSLKQLKNKRRQCMKAWEYADREVKSKQLELYNVKADTTRLQESIGTLLALPEKCSNLIDNAFNNERVVFGKLPPTKKIFT